MQLVFNLAYTGVCSLREAMDMSVEVLDEAHRMLVQQKQAEETAHNAAARRRR